jgi:hypothetical protein
MRRSVRTTFRVDRTLVGERDTSGAEKRSGSRINVSVLNAVLLATGTLLSGLAALISALK